MTDPPATRVYAEMIHRQYEAIKNNADLEREFPEECKIWNDRYSA